MKDVARVIRSVQLAVGTFSIVAFSQIVSSADWGEGWSAFGHAVQEIGRQGMQQQLELERMKLDHELKMKRLERQDKERDRRFEAEIQDARVRSAQAELSMRHPNWREIVGPQGSHTPYRNWLAKQPHAYQRRINASMDVDEIAESIDEFKASEQKK